jgi:hypothetical protein
MPDFKTLKVGDRVRLLNVPDHDLAQRERELREGVAEAGWTADSIERIIDQDPIVTISQVDEYGFPWFECELVREDGTVEFHSLNISDDDSWELT